MKQQLYWLAKNTSCSDYLFFKLQLIAGQQGALFSFSTHPSSAASLTQRIENMFCVDAGFVFAVLCGASELSSTESRD